MKTLIVYDKSGNIYTYITGDYKVPIGLTYLELEVPEGEKVIKVDVQTKKPIFEAIKKDEVSLLKEELNETKLAILELADIVLGGA